MIELTEEQQRAVDAGGGPPRFVDPRTKTVYVLVPAEDYDRVSGFLAGDDDIDMRQVAVLVERAMREDDAGDPTLAFYQEKHGNGTQPMGGTGA